MTALIRDSGAAAGFGDRFSSVRRVRSGPSCSLFEAVDHSIGGKVAVKVPNDSTDRSAIDALRREGDILSAIGTHPHIIRLRERITLPDARPALVLDRFAGSLDDLSGGPAPSVRSVVSMGIKLSGALETVHHAAVLHTRVRPASIYLTTSGEPVVNGFDDAIFMVPDQPPPALLQIATAHTAPELLQGSPLSEATDVYGLGITLYELLAGHPAYPSRAGEPQSELGLRILRGARASLRAGIPAELVDLLGWALAVDPAERPPGPAWLAETLLHVESSQGWSRTTRVTGKAPSRAARTVTARVR